MDQLILIGIIVVFVGIFLIFVGSVLENEGKSKFAFWGFIGPLPFFGSGNGKNTIYLIAALAVIIFILFIIFGYR